MEHLLGIPTHLLAAAAALALALTLLGLALLARRRPVLVRLGVRAVRRRRLRSALIVLGLTTSTAVIATAVGSGETMGATIRAAVAGGIGPVDAVIVVTGRAPAAPSLREPQAVLAGSDLAAGAFFPSATGDALSNAVAGDPLFAAVEPSMQAQATAISPASGRAHAGVNVLGLRPGAAVFDRFTDSEGNPITLADLEPSEALVNAEAARLLALRPGDEVHLRLPEQGVAVWRVRAVVRDGGIAGMQAAVLAPLPAMQAAMHRPDQLNQVLVAFAGPPRPSGPWAALHGPDTAFEARSRAATGRLRAALADPQVLARAARGLATEAGQGQLRALEGRVRPEARPAIVRLREAARAGRPSPDLAYYLADPLLTTQYRWVINALAGEPSLRGRELVDRLAPLTVLEVKQRAIVAANEYGSAVTSIFLILGLFSIAASLLLVFLIFVMLAAERRAEMGMMRAVGAQRGHLIAAFAVEGFVYDLFAAVLGLLFGVGIGAAVVRLVQRGLDRFDVTVEARMSAGAMLLSFCLGALVTFLTVLLAAWRVSRVNIIAAVHGAPEPGGRAAGGARRTLRRLAPLVWCAIVGAGGLALLLLARGPGVTLASGAALVVLALALAGRTTAVLLGAGPGAVDRVIASVVGPVVAALFALLPSAPSSVRSEAVVRTGTAGFVLAGVVMALALVWVAGHNLSLLLWPLVQVSRIGGLAPAARMAIAYPRRHAFRTSLTAAMFALVFLTMVAATALLRSTEVAYVRPDSAAGFDIRAQFAQSPEDLVGALARSEAVRIEDFTAIGAQAMSAMEALWPDERAPLWRPVEVRAADDALLTAAGGQLLARAAGYRSDDAVWRALRDQPGTAIVSRRELDSLPRVQEALAKRNGDAPRFEPAAVWLRDPRGGPARRLTIIGVTPDGAMVPSGLLTSRVALAGAPAAGQPPAEFFLRTRPDVSYRAAATGIQLTFADLGVRTRVLGDEARTGQAVRELLDSLIRGFLGMGLVSGLAALAVVGMRSVAERRQQIGMLRALGFSRRAVQVTFVIEGSVVAGLGISVGLIVGLVLARNVVLFLGRDFAQLQLVIPWGQVAAIALAAYGAALLSALLVAWQAGRVAPAEALRYE